MGYGARRWWSSITSGDDFAGAEPPADAAVESLSLARSAGCQPSARHQCDESSAALARVVSGTDGAVSLGDRQSNK
jgi:hypothetical protein